MYKNLKFFGDSKDEIGLDFGLFSRFFFEEKRLFYPLLGSLSSYSQAKKALYILGEIKKKKPITFTKHEQKLVKVIIENGENFYWNELKASVPKAMEDLKGISRKLKQNQQFKDCGPMVGYIDTKNGTTKEHIHLVETIIDLMYSDINIDLSRIKIA